MLKLIQKIMMMVLLTVGLLYLLYQGFLYYRAKDKLPPGMTVAGLNVAGLTLEETSELLSAEYLAPLFIYHRDELVEMNPQDVGFYLDLEAMMLEADALSRPEEPWIGYMEFVVGRSLEPINIELQATHDRDALLSRMQMLASFLDVPATGPQLIDETQSFHMGASGYITDIEASLPAVEAALYDSENREATLIVIEQEAEPFDINTLEKSVIRQTAAFDGMSSIFILDLQTGEEVSINADVALSGLSVVKIAILLETYRAIDNVPNSDQAKLIDETAINSGNFSANLLLDVVAGQDNAYLGVDILTESMQRLGLKNTFIVTPYEEPNRPGKTTRTTPANSRVDINTFPDPTMQTTAEDMGTLLSMIYHCANGGGTLTALYAEQVTPTECQAIIDVLSFNEEGNLIRFGVPEGVAVAHKHGWAGNTHGDAGIVYSPGGDYIIVEYLTDPESDWLVHDISFPILREISREVYNYFNVADPYFGDALAEDERFDEENSNSGAVVGDGAEEVEGEAASNQQEIGPLPEVTPEATPDDESDIQDSSIEA